jgi:transposase-like protein
MSVMSTFNEKMIRSESGAQEFLINAGILRTTQPCMLCGSTRIEPANRGRSRCSDCGSSWEIRRGSIIEDTGLTCRQFIRIARFFADDIPPGEAAERLRTDTASVNRMYRRIRRGLLNGPMENAGVQAIPPDPPDPEGAVKCPGGINPEDPVAFGIRTWLDTVSIEPFEPANPDIITTLEIPRMIRGNILFIDACERNYHGIIAYLPGRVNQETIIVRPKNRGSWPPLTVFWRFAQIIWSHHRYMERTQIPEFVQELAFRYNHRNMDMFHAVLGKLSQYDYPA